MNRCAKHGDASNAVFEISAKNRRKGVSKHPPRHSAGYGRVQAAFKQDITYLISDTDDIQSDTAMSVQVPERCSR